MRKLLSRFDKYLIATVILAIPLYPKFPLFKIPNTYVSVRLEDFLILIVMLSMILIHLKSLKNLLKNKVFIAIMLFITAGFVSYLSAVFITKSVNPSIGLLHLIRRIEYISLFLAGYLTFKKDSKNLNFYLKLIPIVILIAFVYGFGQKYFTWPIVITQNEEYSKGIALRYVEGSHINSTFAGHYDLATYLVLFLPFVLALTLKAKGFNIYYLIVYFSGLWLLVNTASRISFVSFMAASVISLVLLKRFKKGLVLLFASILFIGFSSNLISRYERVFQIIRSSFDKYVTLGVPTVLASDTPVLRRETILSPTPTPIPVFEDRSTSIRLNVEWPRAIRAFQKNPLLGTGYSSITLATDNDYLRLLGETGIAGFLSFFLIFSTLSLPFVGYLKGKPDTKDTDNYFIASFIGGMFGVFINAIFIDVFEASKFAISLWLFVGILYALVTNKLKSIKN